MDIFTQVENRFDRLTYQNDLFFWFLVLLHLFTYIAMAGEWIPIGSAGGIMTVLLLFIMSWIYTNSSRRGASTLKSVVFTAIALLHPIAAGVVYFIFRPKVLIVTVLPPGRIRVWPIFDGPVWIFMRAPFRFLIKLALWMMGIAFLIIGILDILWNDP